MPEHARPPDQPPRKRKKRGGDGDGTDDLPAEARSLLAGEVGKIRRNAALRALRLRKLLESLPADDPILLIDELDANGGISGTRKKMNPVQMEAFRVLCRQPPNQRSLPTLTKVLAMRWNKAPNRKTLDVWSSTYEWQELLRRYDGAVARVQVAAEEKLKRDINERQVQIGQALSGMGLDILSTMYQRHKDAVAAEASPQPDVAHDAGGGKGGRAKKAQPTLNGMHAAVFMVEKGVAIERTAAGLPSVITSGSLTTDNRNVDVTLTLDEWRKQIERERGPQAALGPGAPSAREHKRAIVASESPRRLLERAGVADEDDLAAQLPDGWLALPPPDNTVVEADPSVSVETPQERTDRP